MEASSSPKPAVPVPFERGGINEYGYEMFGFPGIDLVKLMGPGVYMAATKRGEEWEYIYVGSAKNILARISDESHGTLRQAMKVEGFRLFIAICKSEAHARQLEGDLICEWQPIMNRAGKSPNSARSKALAQAETTA